jgi:LmbE family N-acetylglucosaminyl deacetylase
LAGTARLEQVLRGLNVVGSVLMIAAHPDDENTAVLAWASRGRHLRAGYLSATRGEGGQNLLGAGLGDELGIIRTQELLAARRIDGAEQFFTRAIDFGFSKSADETLAKWGRERTLGDMVWVIRRFRPDVIVLRFSGTSRDGHGHHQASSMLGREAFAAAADAARFPEQLRDAPAWRARRLVFNVFSFSADQERAAATTPGRVEVDTGEFDPVLGHSYNEIAGMSRSLHRSQGMGAPERRGASRNYFTLVAGEPMSKDLFEGIDTTWRRLPGGAAVAAVLARALAAFDPRHPEKTIPALAEARPLVAAIGDPLARMKLVELDEAVALCAGLWVGAQADEASATPGAAAGVTLTVLNRSPFPLALEGARMEGIWNEDLRVERRDLAYNRPATLEFERTVPAGEPYTQPYWLRRPKSGDAYTVDDPRLLGLAEAPAAARVRLRLAAAGAHIEITRPVEFRYVDRTEGERVRPFVVTPPVAVKLAEPVIVFPTAGPRKVHVSVEARVDGAAGEVRLQADAGWKVAPQARAFRIADTGQRQQLEFEVTPPQAAATAGMRAVATIGASHISSGMEVIAYAHIPPQTVFPPAVGKLVRADIRVTARKVGYVMGAGDEMPEALRQMGCEVTLLTPSDLEQRDLGEFDAIVTGVRAYNVRADLRANQPRLLEYVRQGGRLVVQFNVTDATLPAALGPYPFRVGRDRVAVEDAAVTLPDPASPLLNAPNKIVPSDFDNWVQERGLYFASDWDQRYQTVLECHDPGEPPRAGGELWARYGKGVYIFTAYAWFRQLPAGVAGAFRLFANRISAK